jgi:hypothetical protein
LSLATTLTVTNSRLRRQTTRRSEIQVKRDFDGEWIVDYAGPHAHQLLLNKGVGPAVLADARAFAHRARDEFRRGTDVEASKLFDRYSQLVRYLDACGP